MHPEDAFPRELDEGLMHELVPADDEDELGLEPTQRVERLGRVDVARLDVGRAVRRCNVVEA